MPPPSGKVSGLAQLPPDGSSCDELFIPGMHYDDTWFIEVNMCRYALRNSSNASLKTRLKAGCRSKWLCPLAALERREDCLALAATKYGCVCDAHAINVAAYTCDLSMLHAAHKHASLQWGGAPPDLYERHTLDKSIEIVAGKGSAECLGALLDWLHSEASANAAAQRAAEAGHLNCLEELKRWARFCIYYDRWISPFPPLRVQCRQVYT